jgi:hypothetical protein
LKKKDKSKDKKKEIKKAERNGSFIAQPIVSKLPSLSRVGRPASILVQVPNASDSVVVATVTGKRAFLARCQSKSIIFNARLLLYTLN